ncbi:HNH endonuclease [Candidatus Sumerlaeota bacterium]|nr:HNH endonuclease [Candidatus Sumerlaeota bacterium]
MNALLTDSVLVLNRNWLAVRICTVRRALVLLYREMAQVVTPEYETYDFQTWCELSRYADSRVLHTPRFQIKVPDVIKLIGYTRTPPLDVKFNRRNIFLRDNFTCQYCGRKAQRDELTIDHVIPRSRGGKSTWENVVIACIECNAKKGDSLPQEKGLQLRRKPKKPHWLITCRRFFTPEKKSVWQKFIDHAYWNVILDE